MRLILLGGLALEPSAFTRPKPLLLLAYLHLEGPRSRREVAELFWQGSKDPMQGLRMALLQLKDVPEAIQSDEKRVWTDLPSDLSDLKTQLSQGNLREALARYKGPFLEGFALQDVSEELEEWLFQTRERIAGEVREAVLDLAEQEAKAGDFKEAAKRAEQAYLLRFAPEPESMLLSRIYTLLRADENPQAESVAKEARAYGLELALLPQTAKQQLLALEAASDKDLSDAASLNTALFDIALFDTALFDTASSDAPATLPKRRATDFLAENNLAQDAKTEPSPTTLVVDHVIAQNVMANQVLANQVVASNPTPDNPASNNLAPNHLVQATLAQPSRSRLGLVLPLLLLAGTLALAGIFFGLRERKALVSVGNPADDADVSLDNGDNYFCPQHPHLYLSSNYAGQSTALRFRETGLVKPEGKTITVQSALILLSASAHIPEVPRGSGFVVRGLFDSSPWLVNAVCEQIRPPAGNNYASRVRTQASVDYQPDTWNITQQYSVDVTSIVQEIVASPDWTGDGVAFAIDNLSNSSADLKAYSNEGGILQEDLSRQPQFVVTFTTKQD